MSMAGPASTPHDARNLEAGMLLIGLGALLLLISLFLTWYQPEVDAWEVFEVWDLVLAVLAIVALVAVAGRMGVGAPRPSSWLIGSAFAALIIVLYAIVNPPPLTRSIDGDPDTGLWLALAAALLMTIGVVLSVARISVAFSAAPHGGADAGGPLSGRRFGRGGTGPGVAEPGGLGGRGTADPGAPGPGGVQPTEPTRRL